MAGITLAQAEAQLATWLAADAAVATGQDVSINGKRLSRANAAEIRNNIAFWDAKVQQLTGGGIAIKGGTPC